MKLRTLLTMVSTCVALASWLSAAPAHASGAIERMLQVVRHPADSRIVALRFGIASEGLLLSRDGGRSFRALCAGAIDAKLERIRELKFPYAPTVVMDAQGRLLVNDYDAVWGDDGSGCSWATQTGLEGKFVMSLGFDPHAGAPVAVANVATGTDEDRAVRAELLRRAPGGAWEVVGTLQEPGARKRTLGGDLLVAPGARLYATVVASSGPIDAPEVLTVVASRDGGKTWSEHPLPPALQELKLLAVDPREPDRVLGATIVGDRPDALWLSLDGGKSFQAYGSTQQISGVTFAPDGRVFVGDAGEPVTGAPGGVFTAARLGDPLTRTPAPVDESPDVDCVDYDAHAQTLRVCKIHRFGVLDWSTGAFQEMARFEGVAGLLECPGRDLAATCEAQLNSGAAWCCTGHFPFTPFCGGYDVHTMNGRPVACGLAGREADILAGRGPTLMSCEDDACDASPALRSSTERESFSWYELND